MTTATYRVLVADEDEAFRGMLARYLTQSGVTVQQARDGETAWQLFTQQFPDVVLTAPGLPKVSGRELVTRIRGHGKRGSAPVLIMGWGGLQDEAEAQRQLKVEAVFRKPLPLRDVLSRMDALVMLHTGQVRTGAVVSQPPRSTASSPPRAAAEGWPLTPQLAGEASLPSLAAVAVHAFEQRLNGALEITDGQGTRTLVLQDGLLVDARTTRLGESLAAQLVADGVLNEATAHQVGSVMAARGGRFGEMALLTLGVPASSVVAALERQRELVAVRALSSFVGNFALKPLGQKTPLHSSARLDPLSLVMQACLELSSEGSAQALLQVVADWPLVASDAFLERSLLLQRLAPETPVPAALAAEHTVRAAMDRARALSDNGVRQLLALLLTQALKVSAGSTGAPSRRAAVLVSTGGPWTERPSAADTFIREMVAAEWIRSDGKTPLELLGLTEHASPAEVEAALTASRQRLGPPALDTAALGPARHYLDVIRARREEAARTLLSSQR